MVRAICGELVRRTQERAASQPLADSQKPSGPAQSVTNSPKKGEGSAAQ